MPMMFVIGRPATIAMSEIAVSVDVAVTFQLLAESRETLTFCSVPESFAPLCRTSLTVLFASPVI